MSATTAGTKPLARHVQFDAAHVLPLAAFTEDAGSLDSIDGPSIQLEPAPSGGVDLFAHDRHAGLWIHDPGAKWYGDHKPVRITIPEGFVEVTYRVCVMGMALRDSHEEAPHS